MTLGLDVSDGAARAVVVDEEARVLARGEHAFGAGGRPTAAAAAVRDALAGVAGAVPRAAIALPHPGDRLPPELAEAVGALLPAVTPAVVGAGLASVVAEQWCGAARGLQSVVALSAGEHVTGGILLDGRPWAGANDLAGSMAWLSLNPVEREDYRRFGGFAADVSASGIVRRIVWRIKSGDRSVAVERAGDVARITPAHVFDGALSGDGLCISVIRDTARYVGMALSNLTVILDPQIIVLGGLIATRSDLLLDVIRQECVRRLQPPHAERLRIVLSSLDGDAAAIGAARLAAGAAA